MSELMPVLVEKTGLSVYDLTRVITNAPSRYKVFPIQKRNGGVREIAQPAREVKILQRILMREFLVRLPVHDAARAYREGLSIRDNASPHAGDGPILKLDFKDFFPSIGSHHWIKYCDSYGIIEDAVDRWITSRLFFYKRKGHTTLRLSIGAPTSPMLSNILMYEFDKLLSEAISIEEVVYTRYADDLTFSARRTGYLNAVRPAVDQVIRNTPWPDLRVNELKTVLATRKYKRQVTGLILANDGRITIGKEKKRELRAGVHHFILKKLTLEQAEALSGLLAYVNAVEPKFLDVLIRKYGAPPLEALQRIGAKRAQ